MLECIPFSDFSTATAAVLSFLQGRLGFDLWMVTRIDGDSWTVLQTQNLGYDVTPGQVFHWPDLLCYRMTAGTGPHVAPNVQKIPAYVSSPVTAQVPIGAYIGIPLCRADGSLFGTLCAVHPTPRPDSVRAELPLVEMLGRFLSTTLEMELCQADQVRRNERVQADAMRDTLTGLYNRAGWEKLLEGEEERCRRFGNPACVVAIDLDGMKRVNRTEGYPAGDDVLRRAGQALRAVTLTTHVAARMIGDDFCVMGIDCGPRAAAALCQRIEHALQEWRITATLAAVQRDPARGLRAAWREAERRVHTRKQSGEASHSGLAAAVGV